MRFAKKSQESIAHSRHVMRRTDREQPASINDTHPTIRLSVIGYWRLRQRRWSAWQDLHLHSRRFELRASTLGYTRTNGAPGQGCTDTVRSLSPPPLLWATGADS